MAKNIGMQAAPQLPGYLFKNDFLEVNIIMDFIKGAEDAAFINEINDLNLQISEAKQKEADKIQADKDA
ncbi:hypothetical protein ACI3PL_28575, partial [Lacticaseibacillus paracasei]